MRGLIRQKLTEELNKIDSYKQWLSNNVQKVKISSIKDINRPTIDLVKRDVDSYINQNKRYKETQNDIINFINNNIKLNECFQNAGLVFQKFMNNPDFSVEFVLGIMIENGKKIGHGWNMINGKFYDFTMEKADTQNKNVYFKVASFNNINDIKNLPIFDVNNKCVNALTVNGESYDNNGMCSIYPYYINSTRTSLAV